MICPSEQLRTASISTSNVLPFSITVRFRRSSTAGASAALRAWKSRKRSSCDCFSASLERLRDFQARNAAAAPQALERLRRAVIENGNTFDVLMDAVRSCSLGQITGTLYEVGGRYRRNM